MKKNNKKGFTLVELVIVIAVIAILAAVLVPTISSVINSANKSAAESDAATLRTACMLVENKSTNNAFGSFDDFCAAAYNAAKKDDDTFDWKNEDKEGYLSISNNVLKIGECEISLYKIADNEEKTNFLIEPSGDGYMMKYITASGFTVKIYSSKIDVAKLTDLF